jgi:plastocyanin
MKAKILLTLMAAVSLYGYLQAKTVTISNSGYFFTPDEITVNQGDTVIFSLGITHNAVEVSQSTWDANGNTPDGGFSVGYGGGQVIMDTPGTFYYVCTPHAAYGMKGIINVTGIVTSAKEEGDVRNNSKDILNFYPNPVSDIMYLSLNINSPAMINVNIVDITGRVAQNLIDAHYETGNYSEAFSLKNLRSGKYFILFRSEYENAILPLLIIK